MSVLHTQAPQASLGWDESRAKHPFIHSEAHRSRHEDIVTERERERERELVCMRTLWLCRDPQNPIKHS